MSYCADHKLIRDTVAEMQADDPIAKDLPPEQFMFSNGDLFIALQRKRTHDEIRELVERLAPTIENPSCKCGETDPFICGATFVDIIDEMFVKPEIQ